MLASREALLEHEGRTGERTPLPNLGASDFTVTAWIKTGARGGTLPSLILVDGAATDGGPPLTELSGRWLIDRGLITTAIALV